MKNSYIIALVVSIGLIISTPSIDSLIEEIENITITYKDGSRIISNDNYSNKTHDSLHDYSKVNNFIFFKIIFADVAEQTNYLKTLRPKTKERLYFGILSSWIRIY